jgi:hypothetical protein
MYLVWFILRDLQPAQQASLAFSVFLTSAFSAVKITTHPFTKIIQ